MSAQAAASGAETVGTPAVMHVWVSAGHTMCELEEGDPVLSHLEELKTPEAPVCGPCLLIVGRVRRQASALLALTGGAVAPQSPTEAWRLIGKSPWSKQLDIDAFLRTTPDLDQNTHFDAISYAIDPGSVAEAVTEMRRARSTP